MERKIDLKTVTESEFQKFKSRYYRAFTKWLNSRAKLGTEAYEENDIFGHQIQVVENRSNYIGGVKVIAYFHINPNTGQMGLFRKLPNGVQGKIGGLVEGIVEK